MTVALYSGNRDSRKQFAIHRLVAQAFVSNPNGYEIINHIDENKLNNRSDNLEWCNYKYNSNYGTAIERRVMHQDWNEIARKHSKPVAQYTLNGDLVAKYASSKEYEKFGFRSSGVSRCCNGYLNTYKSYIWRYID